MDPNVNAPVFDAAAILGIGPLSNDPMPDPEPGFVTLRVPDGLSLHALRESAAGKQMMHPQSWYDRYPWSKEALLAVHGEVELPGKVPDVVESSVHSLPSKWTVNMRSVAGDEHASDAKLGGLAMMDLEVAAPVQGLRL